MMILSGCVAVKQNNRQGTASNRKTGSDNTALPSLSHSNRARLNDVKVKDYNAYADLKYAKRDSFSIIADSIINYGMKFLKVPYKYGRMDPKKGFDCSGFTSYIFKRFGYQLPRSAHAQGAKFPLIKPEELKRGDLVFFDNRRQSKRIGHVGLVTKVNRDGTFEFIHASVSKGITVGNSQETYYKQRYIGAGRVLDNESVKSRMPVMITAASLSGTKPVTTAGTRTYSVKSGDTLYAIAKKNNTTVTQLKSINGLKSNTIRTGQKLKIL
jgi:cell wall-associated NlpC family hydrolase